MDDAPKNAPADTTAEPANKPSGRGRSPRRPFVNGTSGNPSGKRKGEEPPVHLEARANESQLDAMRWVLVHSEPITVQQWHMRQWLRRDPDEFMAVKTQLERAQIAATPKCPEGSSAEGAAPENPAPPKDVGTARCVELAEALIKRLKEAAQAKKPNCHLGVTSNRMSE